jgi:acyl-CoA synthetase (AMP-forming)/AMP-acid ligase II
MDLKSLVNSRTLWDRWTEIADANPHHEAIIHWIGGEEPFRWSYGRLLEAANKYSAVLKKQGINRGEVCAIIMRHHPEFYPLYLGVIGAGALPAVLAYPNPRLHPEKFRQGLEGMSQRSGLDRILTERELQPIIQPFVDKKESTVHELFYPLEWDKEEFDEAVYNALVKERKSFKRDEPVLLQHSSGTTGLQKPVVLSNSAVLDHVIQYGGSLNLNENDRIVSWLPLYHDMGLIGAFHIPLAAGITSIQIDPFEWVLAPILIMDAASAEQATVTWLPNFAFNLLADKIKEEEMEGLNLSSLRLIINASEPIRAESFRKFFNKFEKYGINKKAFSTLYGMAEATLAFSQTVPGTEVGQVVVDRDKLSEGIVELADESTKVTRVCVASGVLLPDTELKIVDENREIVDDNRVGEIAVKSICMFDGYRNYPEKTAEVIDNEGWFYSGDYGFLYKDELYVIGRKKDIIIVAGKNVYPEDVENAVQTVSNIIPGRLIAFGEEDEELGTETVSVVAETKLTDYEQLRKMKLDIVNAGMDIGVSISEVYLVPPRWLIKSSAGKPGRKANRDRLIAGTDPEVWTGKHKKTETDNLTLWKRWEENAHKYPDKEALVHWVAGEEPYRWTFSKILNMANRFSELLVSRGIKKGEVCAIIIKHNPLFYPLYMGISGAGAIPAVLAYPNPRLHPDKFRQGLAGMSQRSGLQHILTEHELAGVIQPFIDTEGSTVDELLFPFDWDVENYECRNRAALEEIRNSISANDPMLLQHSSGTTGLQKPVVLSHKAILDHVDNLAGAVKLSREDKVITWLPLYHDMGLIAAFLTPLVYGITTVQLDPFEWVIAPVLLLEALHSEKATLTWLPNFAYNLMADKIHEEELEGLSLETLRMVINCSEPVRAESHYKFYSRFEQNGFKENALAACYAMAETTFAVTQTLPGERPKEIEVDRNKLSKGIVELVEAGDLVIRVCVSSGRPIKDCQIKIVDDNRIEKNNDEVGEIAVKSVSLFDGYRNYPEKTAKVLDEHGWYYTGDYGFIYEGELYIIGRKKDIIIVAGKNVYPEDIEDTVNQVKKVIPGRVIAFAEEDMELGTEQVSVIAETKLTGDEDLKKLRLDIIKAGMEIDVNIQSVYLVPPRWLIKSSAGKPSRRANKERILTKNEEQVWST